MSYLSKVLNPEDAIYSNVSFDVLTSMLLVALVLSFISMVWTLVVDFDVDD